MRWLKRLSLTAVILGVLWCALSLMYLPRLVTALSPNPVTESPARVELPFEAISIESGEIELAGWWIPHANPSATLIWIHGAGSNRTSSFVPSLELYKALHDRRFAILTADLRNHGNSGKTTNKLGMGAQEWPDVMAMRDWLEQHQPTSQPIYAMGVSMGGATLIHALNHGLKVDKAVLLDPELNTADAIKQGSWIATGLPPAWFTLTAWSATHWFDLPRGETDALALSQKIDLPTLLIQDPQDPITRQQYAEQAAANSAIELALAPPVTDPKNPCIAFKGRWGTHAAAFFCHPEWTLETLDKFFDLPKG